jgi:hypothetical protein
MQTLKFKLKIREMIVAAYTVDSATTQGIAIWNVFSTVIWLHIPSDIHSKDEKNFSPEKSYSFDSSDLLFWDKVCIGCDKEN